MFFSLNFKFEFFLKLSLVHKRRKRIFKGKIFHKEREIKFNKLKNIKNLSSKNNYENIEYVQN